METETMMETKMNPKSIETNETASGLVVSETVESTMPMLQQETEGRFLRRLRLGAGQRFTRHLLEMMVAMIAGMAVLGVALEVLGEPPGYTNLLLEYGLMGVFMSAPMVTWMRYRGHTWVDGLEMTAAMLLPMFALVVPVELEVVELSEHSLMMLAHVAMIGGMAGLMVYRWDRYTHGSHSHRA